MNRACTEQQQYVTPWLEKVFVIFFFLLIIYIFSKLYCDFTLIFH